MKQAASVIFRTVILLLAGITIGLLINNQGLTAREAAGGSKADSALALIKEHYVDEVGTDSMERKMITYMLEQLDPHSVYLSRQQANTINEKLDGNFNGLGIEYTILRDTMFITQVYPNSPAQQGGILNGDRILAVGQTKINSVHITAAKINALLKGKAGDITQVTVQHLNSNRPQQYSLKHGFVPLSSLDAAYQLSPQTGYIKLSKFAATTDTDFRKALRHLKGSGVTKLVVDLRGNRGGYLSAATSLADEFLTKGKLIVYTKGAHEPRQNYFSTDSGVFQRGPLAILIDEYSASASEIVAGAIQDLDRGIIVGRRSFGKGLVQQQFPFNDGSAINLTVARYYTPSGRSIQKSYKNGYAEYRNEINVRQQKGELNSEAKNLEENGLKSAIYFTKGGRKVYGGGGIMPDIFVPEDTTGNVRLLAELTANQLFTAYTIDKLQPAIAKYNLFDDFLSHFDVDDNQLGSFITYASSTLKEMDSNEIRISKPFIRLFLKAYAARFKWGDTAYFRVMNSNDPDIKRAITALHG